jgi:hypothetical protein
MQVIDHIPSEVVLPEAAPARCLTIGNVEFIGERTIVTLPEPLGDDKCHSHVREYRGEVGPANLVREYDRF